MGKKLNVAVLGLGYWGPNIARNIVSNPRTALWGISDIDPQVEPRVKSNYPGALFTQDPLDFIRHPDVDVVAITTPPSTHFELAKQSLDSGKHVLVAKPLATRAADAATLVDTAKRLGRTLLVDHTFVYTDAVMYLKRFLDQEGLGHLYYFDSVRVNLGLYQHDVNVVWDLAAHDFSILTYLFPDMPLEVQAVAARRGSTSTEDVAWVTVHYANGMIAHMHVSWLSPVKVRMTLLAGSRKMVVWNDLESDEKLKVYDRGIDLAETSTERVHGALVDYRLGDISIPHLDRTEALSREINHFVDCVDTGSQPLTDGIAGWRVVRLLEAANRSLANGGVKERI